MRFILHEIVAQQQTVSRSRSGNYPPKVLRARITFAQITLLTGDAQIPSDVSASGCKRLLVVYVPLSRLRHLLAPVAEKDRRAYRPPVDFQDRPTSADFASQLFGSVACRASQIVLCDVDVVLSIPLLAPFIYDASMSCAPLRVVFWKRLALLPCQLAGNPLLFSFQHFSVSLEQRSLEHKCCYLNNAQAHFLLATFGDKGDGRALLC